MWPVICSILDECCSNQSRLFEIGCGNGSAANMLNQLGYDVTGIDLSESGIATAKQAYPDLKLYVGNAYDNLSLRFGKFPAVISLEVIEHCYYPRKFVASVFDLLDDHGLGILTTPFHGYWKNLAISLLGRWDGHFTALWDHGHIKFFSEKTLRRLLREAGFQKIRFLRVGRFGPLAKSMVAIFSK